MHGQEAIVISGTARHSLGAALALKLSSRLHDSPLITVDKQHNPGLDGLRKVYAVELDLNPLTSATAYDQLPQLLRHAIRGAQARLGFTGVRATILSAGSYESGQFEETSLEARKRLIGVNVCGKLELLHAVLGLNQSLGFNSSNRLTIIDIGSLHALALRGGRALYAATKALALDLIVSLRRGGEVSRAIYLAPGPVDTHMLHRNHWVSKERGSVEFFDHVRAQDERLYSDIFERCDDEAFYEASKSYGQDAPGLSTVFARYKVRRAQQFGSSLGVLHPGDVAELIAQMIVDEGTYSDGVYILTAPSGQVRMEQSTFAQVNRPCTEA